MIISQIFKRNKESHNSSEASMQVLETIKENNQNFQKDFHHSKISKENKRP